MIEFFERVDRAFFLFVNSRHDTFTDSAMYWISDKFFWIPFYVFLLVLMVWKFKKRTFLIVIVLALLIMTSDQISVLTKNTFQRYRPCHNLELKEQVHLINGCGGQYGFVSSHAANSFALASFLLFLFRKKNLKWLFLVMFLWASLVSYSRIYTGVHYPFDILGGVLLGVLLGMLFYKLYFHFFKKFFPSREKN